MSQAEHPDEPSSDERPSPLESPETRVDAAHVRADEPLVAEQPAGPSQAEPAPVECAAGVTAQHVRQQANQLGTHLQRRQSSVDHRESELNARLAAMENQVRAARLWLDERHAELAAQTAELDRRERELAHGGKALSDGTGTTLSPNRQQARFADADGPHDDSIQTYREDLQRADSLLTRQQAELGRERRELAEARAKFAEAMQSEREKIDAQRGKLTVEDDRNRQELKRQSDELGARQAALEQLRSDAARAHRETLEIRLATEELWSQLCGKATPAAVTQSLAQTRLKLAEEQRLARSELAAERTEVQGLAERVARQHDQVVAQRAEVQGWVKARHLELERHARLLSAREREWDEQRAAFEEAAAGWRSERAQLEQEISRLLRRVDPSGVAA